MIYFGSLYSSKPIKWCFSDYMSEKVVMKQMQEWLSQTSRKESKKIFLQAQYYLCCYRKCYGYFLVCQASCSIRKLEIIKILLKSLDTSQLGQKTSTIARLDFWKNTSKFVAKHTCGVESTCYCYGTFLQSWNTLGELC